MNAACASQAFVVPGLMEGQDYLFRVRAENRLGFGPFAITSDPVRARDPICENNQNPPLISCCQAFVHLFLKIFFFLPRPTGSSHQAEGQPCHKDNCLFELGGTQKQWWLSSKTLYH